MRSYQGFVEFQAGLPPEKQQWIVGDSTKNYKGLSLYLTGSVTAIAGRPPEENPIWQIEVDHGGLGGTVYKIDATRGALICIPAKSITLTAMIENAGTPAPGLAGWITKFGFVAIEGCSLAPSQSTYTFIKFLNLAPAGSTGQLSLPPGLRAVTVQSDVSASLANVAVTLLDPVNVAAVVDAFPASAGRHVMSGLPGKIQIVNNAGVAQRITVVGEIAF